MSSAVGVGELLPRQSLLRLLAVLALVVTPHLFRLPLWESVLLLGLGAWRTVAALRGWRMPPAPLKVALTLSVFVGVYLSYGRVSGQHAGIALLVSMLVLKLTELRARRDVMILVFLMYFILITHFLYGQEIWTLAWLLGATVAITAVLIDVNHSGGALPWKRSARIALTMTAQALPLMVLMFVLFPRLPGPLWGVPQEAAREGRTGLSDSLSPGDITRLTESEEPAFRVRFEGAEPDAGELYWRGPVLSHFDGRTWNMRFASPRGAPPPPVEMGGPAYSYEIVLEPSDTHWLLGLDLSTADSLPGDARLTAEYQLVADKPVVDRRLYRATAHTRYRLQADGLDEREQRIQLQLPEDGNVRTRALAAGWRTQAGGDAEAIVHYALRMFREQPFYYTLRPPPLGRDSVDDFLFDSRRGFCEHYASSFAYLMRAAGLPARVVTGYQGGERNAYSDYYLVRQSDAHAWTEVWLPGQGWRRVDPTAAIAPERVEQEALTQSAFGGEFAGEGIGWARLQYVLEARRDQVNALWDRWVLGYGQEQQQELFGRFGLSGWRDLMLALTLTVTAVLLGLGLLLMRASRPRASREPAQRQWQRAQRRLARRGLKQRASEGPKDFADRVAQAQPQLASAMRELTDSYLRIRYGGDTLPSTLRRLQAAADRLAR